MPINNSQPSTPSKYFWKFKGSTGELSRYDKETQESVEIQVPLRFIVLDELNTVKGFNQKFEKGIWSNEVRNLKTDLLHIQGLETDTVVGLYENIKDKLKANGGKFAKSVYIMVADGDEWVIENINWNGASVGAWFEANKKINTGVEAMVWNGVSKEKTGATEYFVPTFESSPITPDEMSVALELNQELQDYLEVRLNQTPQDVKAASEVEEEAVKETKDVVLDDIDDKPIDLSEIPF